MDPREYIDLAKVMIEQDNPGPAACRTVISRSYYAALNVAKGLLEELKIPLDKNKDSHKEVCDFIVASNDEYLKEAIDTLVAQKRVRKHADYEMGKAEVESIRVASKSLSILNGVIARMDGVRGDPERWKVAAENIKNHARIMRKF